MHPSHALRRMAVGSLCALGAGLSTAGPASAAPQDQTWNCRASSSYTAVPGQDRNEPVVANGSSRTSTESPDRARCADDEARPAAAGQGLNLQGPTAKTTIDPDTGLAVDQRVSAVATVNDASSAGTGFVLIARVARAEAVASCTGSKPTLSGTSRVDQVLFNGQEVDTEPAEQQLGTLPTGETVTIRFNEQGRAGGVLTQRAVHVEFRNQLGQVVREIVVAEARVSGGSEVCDRAAQQAAGGGNGNGNGSGNGAGGTAPCTPGAEYDAANNLCIITRERDGNLANGRETVVVVGRPYEGPSGGRVVPMDEVPASVRNSPCMKGKGVRYVVLGTSKADRITGSNKADRIFTFAGADRVSGGRGDDCIDGGTGNDRLAGAQGKDTVIGGRGADNLNGGSEADTLSGGAGNDTINAAYGADRVSAGAGRDAINVATAGPKARVNCGSGRDTVRTNRNERRRTTGCERRYFIR